jgi:hypothetical protein
MLFPSADRRAVLHKSCSRLFRFTHGAVTSSRGEQAQTRLPSRLDGGVEHVLYRVSEPLYLVEELLGREVHQREAVVVDLRDTTD